MNEYTCARCGDSYEPRFAKGVNVKVYCSKVCKLRAKGARKEQAKRARIIASRGPDWKPARQRLSSRTCSNCAEVFQPNHSVSRFCSQDCYQDWLCGNPRLCEVDGCTRKHAAKGFCINHYSQWRRASGLDEAPGSRWPSKRAEYWGVEYEPISAAEVYAEDGFVCQLCGGLVDVTRFHPDPLSPSLDHVVPMSKGGPHLRSNVQTAHLGCNISKGNRVEVGAA